MPLGRDLGQKGGGLFSLGLQPLRLGRLDSRDGQAVHLRLGQQAGKGLFGLGDPVGTAPCARVDAQRLEARKRQVGVGTLHQPLKRMGAEADG